MPTATAAGSSEDAGQADDRERDHVVEQNDARGHHEAGGVSHVVEPEQQLDEAVDERGAEALLPAVAVADEDQGQHADDGHAAAEGQVDLDHAEHGGDGDRERALHETAGPDTVHFPVLLKNKNRRHRNGTTMERVYVSLSYDGMIQQVPRVLLSRYAFGAPVTGQAYPLPAGLSTPARLTKGAQDHTMDETEERTHAS